MVLSLPRIETEDCKLKLLVREWWNAVHGREAMAVKMTISR